ncbi:hypothetical protein IB274_07270 [Pseudomonas sp. PDM18]|uniref:hypothetical protein n=1 Tax=unclassified Pseudomonas TaxID=196821 RepID=UPI001780B624|nr:hypothetical protein [Pseudomonas sp. PDM18]MBD9676493.1 hypothetical protein [Pseudomonas sp. PDM18]MDF3865356.1 hypothetical protein [Pseudomonas denitrificans (nom. rej.)]
MAAVSFLAQRRKMGAEMQEKLMNPPSCHDVADLLHRSYPLFDFTCDRQEDGRYLISLQSRYTSTPRTNVIGIHGRELRTDRQVRDLGMELICGLM